MSDPLTRVLRRSLEQFIAEAPSEIIFIRSVRVPDGAGGFKDEPAAPLPPQTVRVVRQGTRAVTASTLAGVVDATTHVVVGHETADMQAGDEFTWEDENYRVTSVIRGIYRSRSAEAVRIG